MAFSPEDRSEIESILLATVGGLVQGLQRHLDEQIIELQADVDTALEKLDSLGIDVKETRLHVAKLSREQVKERRRDETVSKRLADIERRLTSIEKGA